MLCSRCGEREAAPGRSLCRPCRNERDRKSPPDGPVHTAPTPGEAADFWRDYEAAAERVRRSRSGSPLTLFARRHLPDGKVLHCYVRQDLAIVSQVLPAY
jgi:hypothetical protein